MSEDPKEPKRPSDETVTGAGDLGPATDFTDLPERIGRYRIIGKLGEGGMGVVFEAEQEQPRRRVAVKVVRGGQFVDEARVRLFQREAETLARLKHPNIGAIHESGRTEDGQHFFAMELVRGRDLGSYIADRPSPVTPAELGHRLRLFRQISEAVHYAHQRGVIHRDLKPSNIIVTEETLSSGADSSATGSRSGLPGVKILDFGLARITEGDVHAATVMTEVGIIKGTLPYMSPEQARGNPEEIDLRTDVYALGVILYEMLSGDRPYDTARSSLVEAVRVICEEPPRSLRQSWSGTRSLDVDVETIVGKALEKEADRRYDSAAALGEDVTRYLTSQPILARPPSTLYQLQKLVGRNRLPAAFAAAMLILLVVFAGVMAYQARRIALERDRAETEAARAGAINQFMQDTLNSADPWGGGGKEVTVIEALDDAVARIDGAFEDQPLTEAAVRESIGATYRTFGRYEESEELLLGALALRQAEQGGDHAEVAKTHAHLGSLYVLSGRYAESEETAREALAIQRRVSGPRDTEVAARLQELSHVLSFQGKYEEAIETAEESVVIYREHFGDHDVHVARSLDNLANAFSYKGDQEKAEEYAREGVAIWREHVEGDHPGAYTAFNSLGIIMMNQGELDEAETLLVESMEMKRRIVGDDHPQVAVTLENLGNIYFKQGRYDETIGMLEKVLDLRRRMLGDEHMAVGRTYANMAALYRRVGRDDEAAEAYSEALPRLRAGLGPEHPDVASVLSGQGAFLAKRGDLAGAEMALRESLAILEKAFPGEESRQAIIRIELGVVLVARGSYDEARPQLERGKKPVEDARGPDDPRVKRAAEALAAIEAAGH